MACRAATLAVPVTAVTLYLGGGTPSLMAAARTARLISHAAALFNLIPAAEVTLEANPGTVTRSSLARFRDAGVNRLSLGVQSFDDRLLEQLGRSHSSAQVRQAVAAARQAGFDNLGLDLIHSLPGQTLAQWHGELEQACALAPEHLSIYGLTIEPGTPFAQLEEAGELVLPDEEVSAEMYESAAKLLAAHGYEQYELANFAKPGHRSRHNSGYWQGRPYLGFGAGAHSLLPDSGYGVRCANRDQPEDYLAALAEKVSPVVESRQRSREDAMAEWFYLGLRMTDGVNLQHFRDEFGVSFAEVYGDACAALFRAGLLEIVDGFLRLPAKARVVSNQVFQRFI
jgi:oxygen-independent coproporphyrinogen III oxidase